MDTKCLTTLIAIAYSKEAIPFSIISSLAVKKVDNLKLLWYSINCTSYIDTVDTIFRKEESRVV